MGAKKRRAVGPSRLMEMVRTIAKTDGRSVRAAVERTACGRSAWQNWLHGQQPMVFQQLEQVLENYGYALMPVPMGPEATAAKAAFIASVNRGPAVAAPALKPVQDHADEQEHARDDHAGEHRQGEQH